ncbi:MAG: PHP domain-containing protein [Eubacteriales bacterium]|nr:PHP domain-containing protein [Eubacteriales bacterium]MDD4389785.1 PHP domain-containing protein [Eubacteriales bacterium]
MGTGKVNYRITRDYHTHTIYSDGKNTIEQNIIAAREKGLKGIGITEHGPRHLTYGIKRENISVVRDTIQKLRKIYEDIEIYFGIEANIINKGNHIDIDPHEFADFDYVMAGYHYGVMGGFCVSNFFNKHAPVKANDKKLLIRNTDMMVKAVYENNLKILTHPGDKGPFDIDEVAKACEKTDTLMEINSRHKYLSEEGIRIAKKYDIKFVINSDAHSTEKIGDMGTGLERALAAGLDMSRVINVERV